MLKQSLEDPYAVGKADRPVCDQRFYRGRPYLPNFWERSA